MIYKLLSFFLTLLQGHRLIKDCKKQAILLYLKSLQAARTSIIGVLFLVFAFQIFIVSLIGLVLTGLYLSPLEHEAKVWVLFGLCAFIVLFVILLLSYALSERTWLKKSGVDLG